MGTFYDFTIMLLCALILTLMIKVSMPKQKKNVTIIPQWKLEARKNVRRLYKGPGSVVSLDDRRKKRE
jgi:hypothetical protein